MEISVKEKNKDRDDTFVVLSGSFDASVSKEVKSVLDGLLIKGLQDFVVDLSDVEFIDSSGLGALVGFYKKVRIGEGDVKLTGMSEQIFKIFELTQLNKVFKIIDKKSVKAS